MNAQQKAALQIIHAISESIRELGSIPSGHLYAQVMGHLSLEEYNAIIKILVNAGLVKESNHVLTWIEPV